MGCTESSARVPGSIPGFIPGVDMRGSQYPPPAMHGKGKGNVWKGFYSQDGQNHPLIFKKLKIKNNQIEGKGKDDNGKFKVHGVIEPNG